MPRSSTSPSSQARKQPRWIGLGTVKAPEFGHLQFSNGCITAQDALLDGHIQALQVHPDIWLHAVEGCDLRTLTSSAIAHQGLHILILLEGSVDVAFGSQVLQLSPACGSTKQPQACGALIHTCQHETFVRQWRTGKYERKLSLRVNPSFLASLAHTTGYTHWQDVLGQHLCTQLWSPSSRAVVLAEQIIHLMQQDSASLLLQSRALELLHEALQPRPSDNDSHARPALHLQGHLRMAKLKAMIDAQQDSGAQVSDLARHMGLSASALQRHFRQIYGASIDEYRRTQRLEHARALLEQTGCSVLEVAHASGYTSAANFATAFKRHFGITPKLVRSKI